jgi:hypothetical protein
MGLAATHDFQEEIDWAAFTHAVGELLDVVAAVPEVDARVIGQLEWLFLPLFPFGRRPPKALHRSIASEPEVFCQMLEFAYKERHAPKRDLPREDQDRARLAFEVLDCLRTLPGVSPDGLIDAVALQKWVQEVRVRAAEIDRSEIADQHLGKLFAFSPPGANGTWPHEAIRDVIESIDGPDLGKGLRIGIYNTRGVTSRGLTEGGVQERGLSQTFRNHAASCRAMWPRTARMLEEIAFGYEREASHEDVIADAGEDRRF